MSRQYSRNLEWARCGGPISVLAIAALLAGCGSEQVEPAAVEVAPALVVSALAAPIAEEAAEPYLGAGAEAGHIWMSWLAPEGDDHVLNVSRFDGERWSSPSRVAQSDQFFVNWADFPSVVALDDGSLVSHWLQMAGEGTYTYDVMLARSGDGGGSWSEPVVLHNDGVEAEHGFLSFEPMPGARVAAVWLDGRMMGEAGHHGHGDGSMTLRSAWIGADGEITGRSEIDARVCECCQTGLTSYGDSLVAVYRDRSDDEIRDIGMAIWRDGQWGEPRLIHEDGWRISGCPVNGPAIDSDANGLAVAWFTGANDREKVLVAFSSSPDDGFDPPVRVDLGAPVGRVDVAMLGRDLALVTWIERTGAQSAGVMARTVTRTGELGEPVEVGSTSAARASGFPRIVQSGDRVYAAWTEPSEEGSAVRFAMIERAEESS